MAVLAHHPDDQAQQEVYIEDVDDDERVFIFHSPHEIPTTIDMVEVTVEEARDRGAVACSECFSNVNEFDYKFDYKQ